MERSQYTPLAPSSEGPNPLRPYYRPPSIGVQNPDSSIPNGSVPSSQGKGGGGGPGGFSSSKPSSSGGIGSSARNYLSTIDYNEFLGETGAPTTGESVRALLDSLMWRYSSVFMAQPFEVAKMVLQCYDTTGKRVGSIGGGPPRDDGKTSERRYKGRPQHADYEEDENEESEDDDRDERSYFTSYDPKTQQVANRTKSQSSREQTNDDERSASRAFNKPSQPPWKLDLRKPDSLLEVLSQLWQREGSWGFWKGTNVTFIYQLLFRTLETWTRSMLSALINLPDPGMLAASGGAVGGLDIIDSPSPLGSLSVAVAATGLTGLLLAPLDIVRTRLILTPTADSPRSILPCLNALPSWLCPSWLLAPTILHSTFPTLISTSTPLFLRSIFRIDPIITPAAYSVCTFLSSSAELFLRLPIETVLRRGQINHVRSNRPRPSNSRKPSHPSPQSSRNSKRKQVSEAEEDEQKLNTIVEVGPYTGVIASMWHIAREEGETVERRGGVASQQRTVIRTRKGQGVHGLWRGWRVGWWGLVGVWGASAIGGAGGKGGEF
ncbi:MAG: mitochondrial fusion and transport protein ugo1 [Alyxoria varia]|nr:MAG: mitochondrial fusion and transport protein ugo1 [Alyxoria varia]